MAAARGCEREQGTRVCVGSLSPAGWKALWDGHGDGCATVEMHFMPQTCPLHVVKRQQSDAMCTLPQFLKMPPVTSRSPLGGTLVPLRPPALLCLPLTGLFPGRLGALASPSLQVPTQKSFPGDCSHSAGTIEVLEKRMEGLFQGSFLVAWFGSIPCKEDFWVLLLLLLLE